MRGHMRFGWLLIAGLGLASCGDLHQETGAEVDNGSFGNATMNNTLIQSGQRDYTIALGSRFAAEASPTVNFAFGSAELDGTARATLDQQAHWMSQFPELRFSVYGHTDLVGSQAANQALGRKRAQAVVAYLDSRGISRSRLQALVSYGETRPVIPTPNPEQQNRRTVTEVAGFVQNHPALLNGKYAEVIMREYIDLGAREHPRNRAVVTQIDPGDG